MNLGWHLSCDGLLSLGLSLKWFTVQALIWLYLLCWFTLAFVITLVISVFISYCTAMAAALLKCWSLWFLRLMAKTSLLAGGNPQTPVTAVMGDMSGSGPHRNGTLSSPWKSGFWLHSGFWLYYMVVFSVSRNPGTKEWVGVSDTFL